MLIGPITSPANDSPPNIATSFRRHLTDGGVDVCVSGRHQSMNAAISGVS
jgi:hypothetical protein